MNSDASADQPPLPTLCVRCVADPWEPLKWSANAAAVLKMHNQGVGTEVDRLFEEFCEEFTREMNRLRMEHRASLSAAARESERLEARRKKLIEMVMEGVAPPS